MTKSPAKEVEIMIDPSSSKTASARPSAKWQHKPTMQ